MLLNDAQTRDADARRPVDARAAPSTRCARRSARPLLESCAREPRCFAAGVAGAEARKAVAQSATATCALASTEGSASTLAARRCVRGHAHEFVGAAHGDDVRPAFTAPTRANAARASSRRRTAASRRGCCAPHRVLWQNRHFVDLLPLSGICSCAAVQPSSNAALLRHGSPRAPAQTPELPQRITSHRTISSPRRRARARARRFAHRVLRPSRLDG